MSRKGRIVAPGYPHHVTQRGNYKQTVFEVDADRKKYLALIKKYSGKYGLKIWAYCLMKNHVHFIVVPTTPDSLSKTFRSVHTLYSNYFNKKKEQLGLLWQGRYYSCILDESHLVAAVRYVENNPVRAGIVNKAEEYKWSSAASHVYNVSNPILSNDLPLLEMIHEWREYLYLDRDKQKIEKLRDCTMSGKPAGSDFFITTLEDILGRKIKSKKPGRPKDKEKN